MLPQELLSAFTQKLPLSTPDSHQNSFIMGFLGMDNLSLIVFSSVTYTTHHPYPKLQHFVLRVHIHHFLSRTGNKLGRGV
jgi:hypothetical protein